MQNNKSKTIVAAAIQLNTRIGDTEHNLKASERLANEAVKAGATWIALPEFFNTGMCWDPELVHAIEYEDCLLYTSPSPRDGLLSRMPSSA